MASGVSASAREVISGVKECIAGLDAIQARTDAATIAATKKAQAVAKVSVRSGMRGRPRWDRRGRTGKGESAAGAAVNLNLSPHHVSKGGGPGRLTGQLSKAVGVMKRPRRTGVGQYTGGIGVGGKRSITLIYRKEVEARAPYMAPGVAKAEPKIAEAYKVAWAKATET